jgi:hypothetical protein
VFDRSRCLAPFVDLAAVDVAGKIYYVDKSVSHDTKGVADVIFLPSQSLYIRFEIAV